MIRAAGIMVVDKAGRALFMRRGPGGDMPGHWCFPGGRLEAGEDARTAAARETLEESGLKVDPNDLLPWTRSVTRVSESEVVKAATQAAGVTSAPTPAPLATKESVGYSDGKPGSRCGECQHYMVPGAAESACSRVDGPVKADKWCRLFDAAQAVDFETFILRGVDQFVPRLGPEGAPEHVAFAWAPVDQPPEPIHPGCRIALTRSALDELGVARAIAAGDLTSPQRYGKVWLFDIRITGTGASYRPSLKEYVWREPSLYANDEFLARCNGLPVIWVHPDDKPMIDGKEWEDRAVGTVFLPHLKGGEVWGVSKIYDEGAAEAMARDGLSTSPGVVFSAASGNQELKLADGSTLLIEGKPALLDHIAIVRAGVWDKGGKPSGVPSAEVTMPETNNRNDGGVDAGAILDALKGVGAKLDSAHQRLDAMEADRKDRARKDRKDRARKDKFAARKDGESDDDYKGRHDADETAMMDALRADGASDEEAKADAAACRADAEKEESEEKERKDAAARADAARRRDAGETEEQRKERERQDARHDALAGKNAILEAANTALTKKVDELTAAVGTLTRETTPGERDALASAQARADSISAQFGTRASPPVAGETSVAYRRRLLGPFLKHSERFKDVKLDSVDGALLGVVEDQVYADATDAARVDSSAPGVLIPVISHDEAGRKITRFHGDNLAWMAPFMTGGQVGKINRPSNTRLA